jgi:hypothetical protein
MDSSFVNVNRRLFMVQLLEIMQDINGGKVNDDW